MSQVKGKNRSSSEILGEMSFELFQVINEFTACFDLLERLDKFSRSF